MARTIDVPARGKEKLLSYRYVATTPQGKEVKSTIKATSEIAAERLVVELGYNPISVEAVPSMFSLEEALPTFFQVKPRDVIIFSRQLATLLRSGIALLTALEIIQEQVASSRGFKKVLGDIIHDLRSGGSFPQAIAKHPRAFNDIYCRTLAIGEQSGNMETVLHQMADHLEHQTAMSKKIGKALTYPIMVLGVGIAVMILLVTMVMPNLMGMFTAMDVELPLPTKILMGLTTLLSTYTLYFLIAGAILVVAVLWLVKQPTGRRLLDHLRLKAPLIGPPTLMSELARFSRTMSVLISAGVKLQEIMEMIPQTTSNAVMRDAFKQVNEGLLLGEGLAEPMHRISMFPSLLIQMVAVGEESNTLDFTMGVVADFYETTAEERTAAMVGMIGPISTIGIALLVGFIALAVIMPMYTLTGAFGG